MKRLLSTLLLAGVVLWSTSQAMAFKPAVVFDMGGKFDKSFNEGIWNGLEKFRKETGIKYREFEVQQEAQREQFLRKLAQRGSDPILAVGFGQASAVEKVAKEFPNTRFSIIDVNWLNLPNVQGIAFKEQEGSFLVGVLAAMRSETGKVGFVGGMDIPLIHKFACGYAQGVKYINSGATVFQKMTGTTPAAWNDPARGAELAKTMFDSGADIVFAAAGSTGLGVLQSAADNGKMSIGVDSNQNHLQPGSVLTSMLKRVDVAAYNVFKTAQDGTWESGVKTLGLAEDGVGWALDEHNAKLITSAMKSKVEQVRKGIISGSIKVHDYMSDNKCPVQ
ncbi:MAG: BMP family ABC transporter substrate-binding protein [SAR324 cluster bacterium]